MKLILPKLLIPSLTKALNISKSKVLQRSATFATINTLYWSLSDTEWKVSKQYLKAPSITGLSNIPYGVSAQWTATPDAIKYALFRKFGKNTPGWTKVGNFIGTKGSDTGLKNNFDGQYLTGYHPTGWKKIYILTWEPLRVLNSNYSVYTDPNVKKGVTCQYTVRCADYKTNDVTRKRYYTSAFRSDAPYVTRNR